MKNNIFVLINVDGSEYLKEIIFPENHIITPIDVIKELDNYHSMIMNGKVSFKILRCSERTTIKRVENVED